MAPLPPCEDIDRVRTRLSLAPPAMIDDAVQEAWVAFLSGGCVDAAVQKCIDRETAWGERRRYIEEGTASQQDIPRVHTPRNSLDKAVL